MFPKIVFSIILFLKIICIFFIDTFLQNNFYFSFLGSVSNYLDPWTSFTLSGGEAKDFPFGLIMYLIFIPSILLTDILDLYSQYNILSLSANLTLLSIDLLIFYILYKSFNLGFKKTTYFYWASPLVFTITYLFGATDIVPVLFLTLSLLFLHKKNYLLAMLFISFAVSAKLSMIIIVPFIIGYIFVKSDFPNFIKSCALFFILFIGLNLPILWSSGFKLMAYGSDVSLGVFNLKLDFGLASIYLVPILYLALLWNFINFKRISFELFCAFSFISFLAVIHLSGATLGWYMWVIPFMIFYQSFKDSALSITLFIFSSMLSLYYISFDEGSIFSYLDLVNSNDVFKNTLFSINTIIAIIICFYIYNAGILENQYFKFTKKRVMIAISGDSGSGKDTLSDQLKYLFTEKNTTSLSGDDYHLWERGAEAWETTTHLNPKANSLQNFYKDAINLSDGINVMVSHYDHSTGLFSSPSSVTGKNYILISGLHALMSKRFSERCDLNIYLDTDSELKKFFKLRRDVLERGHKPEAVIKSIERRQIDNSLYIQPQQDNADLIFKLEPLDEIDAMDLVDRKVHDIPLRLNITAKDGFMFIDLLSLISSVADISIKSEFKSPEFNLSIYIDGDPSSTELELIAKKSIDFYDDILEPDSVWSNGTRGLMQLFVLKFISNKIKETI